MRSQITHAYVLPVQEIAPRGPLAGFVASAAEASLRVISPKGAIKPQQGSAPHGQGVADGHATRDSTAHAGAGRASSLSRTSQQAQGAAVNAVKASQQAGAGLGAQQGSVLQSKGRAQVGVGGSSRGARAASEEVEEGELEPGEVAAGDESGGEGTRGAPHPAGATSKAEAHALQGRPACQPVRECPLHNSPLYLCCVSICELAAPQCHSTI